MTAPLRFGVLGAARIADLALLGPATTTGDRVVAVAARDRGRAEAFAAERGIGRVHDDYAGVLADDDVEVVYVPLANGLHGHWTRAAAEAGKHVLVEKPFAANAVEAREVAAVARASGVVVVEAFHHVHHPVLRRMVDVVAAGEIGVVRRVETALRMPSPPDDDPRWSPALAGGAMMDLGCYTLHLQRTFGRFAGGEPTAVSATATERLGVDAAVTAELAFGTGATGTAHCDMLTDPWSPLTRVVGEHGTLSAGDAVLPHLDDTVVVETADGVRTERLGTRSSYTYQLEALRAHLRDDAPFPLDLDDAVAQAELIDAVYRAAGLAPREPSAVPARTA